MDQGARCSIGFYDLAALRSVVTIPELLAGVGVAVPSRGKRIACPVHRGDNPSAFSFDEHRFRCFGCDAHGDVFDLARALHSLTFPQAVEHVARIAGVSVGAMPRATQDQIRRRATFARRRAALRAHRDQFLNQIAAELYDLDRAIEAAVAALTAARGTDREDQAWQSLSELYARRDAAEFERCRLETNRERDWCDVLEEKRGGVGWAA